MERKEVAAETLKIIRENEKLRELTEKAINNTSVYDEGFYSIKNPFFKTNVAFCEELTLLAAQRYVKMGKRTAVLNFANPITPGGGFLEGANAQEEYLCRASNLYLCLCSENAQSFYKYHRAKWETKKGNNRFLASDKIIYSSGITVIRKDVGFTPGVFEKNDMQEYTDEWFPIDVITCAAPYFFCKDIWKDEKKLKDIFIKRIKNIFETAIENKVQSLILGAFGCGAFHNPPAVVADAFSNVLLEERYAHAFEDVLFAVKRTAAFCENIEAFEIAFSQFPPNEKYVFSSERNKRRFFDGGGYKVKRKKRLSR